MESKKSFGTGIIFSILAALFMLLSFGNVFAAFVVVPFAVGFALGAQGRTKFKAWILLSVSVIVIYLLFGDLWQAIIIGAYALSLTSAYEHFSNAPMKFSLKIAWTALVSAVAVFGLFLLKLYVEQGALNLATVIEPIKVYSNELILQSSKIVESVYEVTPLYEMSTEEFVTQYQYFLGSVVNYVISVIPAILGIVIMFGSFISYSISKGLNRAEKPVFMELKELWGLRLSAFAGVSYMLAYMLTMFISGNALTVVSNYILLIEIPLVIEGIIVVYNLLTYRTNSTGLKILAGFAIFITAFGVIINLSFIYVIVGSMDTYLNFREKIKLYKNIKK